MTNSKDTGRCQARKTPCATDKICNPASGRCVLRNGAIGKKAFGGSTSAGSTSTKQTRQKWVPLTLDEVKRQFPKKPLIDHYPRDKKREFMKLFRFGPHITDLTLEMARDLIGKRIYAVWAQDPDEMPPLEYIQELVIHRLRRNKDSRTGKGFYLEGIMKSVVYPNRSEELDEHMLINTDDDGNHAMFDGSAGGDITFLVFVKKEGEPLKPAPTRDIQTWPHRYDHY